MSVCMGFLREVVVYRAWASFGEEDAMQGGPIQYGLLVEVEQLHERVENVAQNITKYGSALKCKPLAHCDMTRTRKQTHAPYH